MITEIRKNSPFSRAQNPNRFKKEKRFDKKVIPAPLPVREVQEKNI